MDSNGCFLQYSTSKLQQYLARISTCLDRLTEDQIWNRGSESQNSAGNLVLHLCGNVRQWIVSGVGGKPDIRDRDSEFAARGGVPVRELTQRLADVVSEASAVISNAAGTDLTRRIRVQGYEVTVLEAIYHVVEHFSHHTGQILFVTKLTTGEDLGFYRHLNRMDHTEKTP